MIDLTFEDVGHAGTAHALLALHLHFHAGLGEGFGNRLLATDGDADAGSFGNHLEGIARDIDVRREEFAMNALVADAEFPGPGDHPLHEALGAAHIDVHPCPGRGEFGIQVEPGLELVVMVVDDGLATGATFFASVEAIRRQHPRFLLGAIPVAPFQTIERRDVGLTLRVRPQVSEGGSIKLVIYQEVSSVQDTTSPAGVITNMRAIETNVLVDDGAIVVLGGLVQDNVSNTIEKVPVLGDIPIFGHLFRFETRKQQKTNLMVFLRPFIVRDDADMRGVTVDRYDRMRRLEESVAPAPHPVLPGTLPFETGDELAGDCVEVGEEVGERLVRRLLHREDLHKLRSDHQVVAMTVNGRVGDEVVEVRGRCVRHCRRQHRGVVVHQLPEEPKCVASSKPQ